MLLGIIGFPEWVLGLGLSLVLLSMAGILSDVELMSVNCIT